MYRFRRLRRDERIRSLMQETRLHPKDFIYPIFVIEGQNCKNPVESMPGIFQYSIDRLDEILEQVQAADIGGIMLLGFRITKTRREVRPMQRMALPRERFVILNKTIRKSTSWWMCVCVSTLHMAIAGWCAAKKS